MRFCILGIGIVGVIGCHQRNGQLPAQLQKLRVDQLLLRDPVILQLQEIVALPKAVPVTDRRLSGLIDQPFWMYLGTSPARQAESAMIPS